MNRPTSDSDADRLSSSNDWIDAENVEPKVSEPIENGPIENGPIENGPIEDGPIESEIVEPEDNIPAAAGNTDDSKKLAANRQRDSHRSDSFSHTDDIVTSELIERAPSRPGESSHERQQVDLGGDASLASAADNIATDNIVAENIVEDPSGKDASAELECGDMVFVGVPVSPPVRILESKPVSPPPKPRLVVRAWRLACRSAEWMFGVVSLLIGLAVVSSIPIVQFASLGYLLEASGRVSRSGRIRDGFMGVRSAARIGGLVLGAWLMYAPLLLINEFWYSAYLIDPTSGITQVWRVVQILATGLCVAHVVVAWSSGGRLRDYFWPFAAPLVVPWNLIRRRGLAVSIPPLRFLRELMQGGLLAKRRDAVWDFVMNLRLPQLFWLGLRGFAGAVAWLFAPIMLLVAASFMAPGPAVLFSLVGAALLTVVLLYLPFLQAQFAAEGEMVAMFDLGAVRRKFRKAPIAFWFSLLITLLFAVPLYLLKIELTPGEILWIPSLVFVAFMFPARLLAGWVLGLASRRNAPRHFVFRWFSRIAQLPIVLAYVGIVYLTQYLSWYGVWSLFEQHAFLTPAPFLGG